MTFYSLHSTYLINVGTYRESEKPMKIIPKLLGYLYQRKKNKGENAPFPPMRKIEGALGTKTNLGSRTEYMLKRYI